MWKLLAISLTFSCWGYCGPLDLYASHKYSKNIKSLLYPFCWGVRLCNNTILPSQGDNVACILQKKSKQSFNVQNIKSKCAFHSKSDQSVLFMLKSSDKSVLFMWKAVQFAPVVLHAVYGRNHGWLIYEANWWMPQAAGWWKTPTSFCILLPWSLLVLPFYGLEKEEGDREGDREE